MTIIEGGDELNFRNIAFLILLRLDFVFVNYSMSGGRVLDFLKAPGLILKNFAKVEMKCEKLLKPLM